MGCGNCGSGGSCSTGGCGQAGGCASGGCNKLNVFDWLQDMALPFGQPYFDLVEVRFKGARKEFFRNVGRLDLLNGDWIVVESQQGWDMGQVSAKGEVAKLQLKKKRLPEDSPEYKKIYRLATEEDKEKYRASKDLEPSIITQSRMIIAHLRLEMKLSDVDVQADRTKVCFFYTAEDRVDFRELIVQLRNEFKMRVEMKQIGLRQEAARLGGIGSCGRELCCSTWLTDFKNVSTGAARYQNLSLNPQKLAGQCGRLKCCLNYELDTYMDALKAFPKDADHLQTQKGRADLQKIDIFRGVMVYTYKNDTAFYTLDPEEVKLLLARIAKGDLPESIEEAHKTTLHRLGGDEEADIEPVFENAEGEGSLNRFDRMRERRGRRKDRDTGPQAGRPQANQPREAQPKRAHSAEGTEKPIRNVQAQGGQQQRNRPERPQPDGTEKPVRNERQHRPERTDRNERPNRPLRPERAQGPEGTERPDRSSRPERPARPDGNQRPMAAQGGQLPAQTDGQKQGGGRNRNRNRRRDGRGPEGGSPTAE